MLATHDQELLTAYVDGELTARQRRAAARLLRRSGEARLLLKQLTEDSGQLKSIPAPRLSVDLSSPVLESIAQRGLKPIRRARVPASRPFPAWTGVAAAAAVLLLVGIGSFLQSSRWPGRSAQDSAKRHENPEAGARPTSSHDVVKSPVRNNTDKERLPVRGPGKKAPERKNPVGVPEKETVKVIPEKEKPEPRDPPAGVLASGEKESSGKLEQVELALPAFFKLHDLDQAKAGEKLLDELNKSSAFRIEILCKDASRGFDRIQGAFSAQKMGLVIEPNAQARLTKPQWKSDYALFFENMKAGDVVKLLGKVGRCWTQHARQRQEAGRAAFRRVGGCPEDVEGGSSGIDEPAGSRSDRRPPGTALRALAEDRYPQAADREHPLAAVDAALDGKGVPRPTGEGNSAVVVTMPNRNRTPELKRFLDGRKPAVPETVQVFLVLRNVGP